MQWPCAVAVILLLLIASSELSAESVALRNDLIENRLSLLKELPRLQNRIGSFSSRRSESSNLRATYHAIYLSHLYGIQKSINTTSAAEYLLDLMDTKPSFKEKLQAIESVRELVLSCLYLGVPLSKESIEEYVYEFYDPSKNLFAHVPGGPATIEATAQALDVISALGLRDSQKLAPLFPEIRKALQASVKSTKTAKYFHFEPSDGTSQLGNCAHAISVALSVEFQLPEPELWAQHIYSELGKIDFDDSNWRATLSVAISSLHKLAQFTNTVAAFQKGMTNVLDHRVLRLDSLDLELAYHLDRILPLTPYFSECLTVHTRYLQDVQDTKEVVQGQPVAPRIAFKFGNFSHSSMSVELVVHTAGFAFEPKILFLDEDEYALPEPIDTHNIFGSMRFSYSSKLPLLEHDVFIYHVDELLVGYSLTVEPHAQLAGLSMYPGETVNLETAFLFDLHVRNYSESQEDILSGSYNASLKLLDSSNVLIYEESKDCHSNSEPLSFSYTLNRYDIVPGPLCFLFQLVDHAIGLHNEHRICYTFSPIAVASHLHIEPATPNFVYHLNQSLVITITPASTFDLSTPQPYSFRDFHSKDVSNSYNFFLNFYNHHQRVLSVPGVPFVDDGRTLRYRFQLDSSPNLDMLSPLSAKFYYQPLDAPGIYLKLYNHTTNTFFHTPDHFSITFDATVEVRDLRVEPNASRLNFGDVLQLSFKLFDSLTGLYVHPSPNQHSTTQVLWRLLKSTSDANMDKYIQDAATYSQDQFRVHLPIRPELPTGDFKLELLLKTELEPRALTSNNKPFLLDLHIDGRIDVRSSLVHYFDAKNTLQVSSLRFKLFSEGTAIEDAQLFGSLYCGDQLLVTHPVSAHGQEYAFSWVVQSQSLTSNNCRVELYTRKTQLDNNDKKIFEQNLRCSSRSNKFLPFNIKLLIFISLAACFCALSHQKWKIEKV
ncbi:uncharacterized protein LOC126311215 isoform X4 [Schistocerca gregaria]|uniref:uncharacterized protein LOC126311215 isoform X4 n=1 Tax=Schistocerca gregaria TaxID=7010 RepID=UPI00211E5083|nr:uncharacterized protein LOC126311215 isoform X4 [Schistocerca gregaria]